MVLGIERFRQISMGVTPKLGAGGGDGGGVTGGRRVEYEMHM